MGTLQSGLKHMDTVFAMLIVFTVALSHSVSAITVFVEWSILNVVSLLQASWNRNLFHVNTQQNL